MHSTLGRGILSDVDADLLVFREEKRHFRGFPRSGLSSIALNRTQFTNWFIYMMFKFSNEKYLAPFPKCAYSPKGICAVPNTP